MFKQLSALSHHAAWRKQLELLLDSASEGIYGIDLKGRCIFINKAGASMLGYTPDEMLGRNMHYLIHHSYGNRDLMPVCECKIFKAFQQRQGCRVDTEVLWRRDGTSFAAEYASTPIVHEEEVLGAVVTFNDITERLQVQALRMAAQVELERRVEERTAELQLAHDRLRKRSAHMNAVREEERIRIAREIHDELGTCLTAMTMALNALKHRHRDNPDLGSRVHDMLAMSSEAMSSLRRILSDLRPGVLDHFGLWAAAEHLLKETSTRSGLSVELSVQQSLEGVRLGQALETALYRILQEMLNNTIKHAQANQFSVQAWQQGTVLHVRMADDGVGFSGSGADGLDAAPPAVRTGYGLLGIEERVWDLGGRCRFQSRPQQGVALDIEIPGALTTQRP